MDRHPLYALSLPLVSIGFVAQLAAYLAHWMYPTGSIAMACVATVAVVVGLAYRAMDKGRAAAWGLTGVLSIVGLAIVASLTNHRNRTVHN